MAFEAERISVRAQQLFVLTSMRLVTDVASLAEDGLVMHNLLLQVADVGMAAGANTHGVGFWQSGFCTGVWAVAIKAITSLRPRMCHFRSFNQFGFITVARNAECF